MTHQTGNVRSAAFAGLAAFIGFALLPNLHADSWDKMTKLTVNEPLQVPSCCTPGHTVTLAPGEYVIALVDSIADRHIVRIFDKDQKNVITTILAIPNYRLRPTGENVFQYWEVPAGHVTALRAWFYPGDNYGQEFAYPKQTAAELAALLKTNVPAIETDTAAVEDLKTAPLIVVDESGSAAKWAATLPLNEPPAMAADWARPSPPAQVEIAAAMPADVETLPQTGTSLPLIGLAGLIALALAAALSFGSARAHRLGE